ncbi:MAG: hypothetical protein WEC80_01210 [Patescibacteria group bacterium]
MKKETLLAIIFGVFMGLIVAAILIFILRPSGEGTVQQADSLLTPKGEAANIMPLEISEPSDRSIRTTESIEISGKVKKDSLIVIESPITEEIIVNSEESFSVDFPLALGENLITIRAYVDKAQTIPQIKTLRVYYLEE